MKDIVTPVPPEEVRSMIKKSLETAALVNYTRLSSEAKIEGKDKAFLKMYYLYKLNCQKTFFWLPLKISNYGIDIWFNIFRTCGIQNS